MDSVNIKKNTPYHHGNLRNELIKVGLEILSEEGSKALSLRKLARRAGVSHNAPYMHFADKEAILAAIAEQGFHVLTIALDTAIAKGEGDWFKQLEDCCLAYLYFALQHPSHLQVMFRYFDPEKHPDLLPVSTGAFERLQDLIRQGQALGHVGENDSRSRASLIWSLMHGLSTLLIGRKIPPKVMGDRSAEELVRKHLQHVYEGLCR